jgi:hypothetical protein
MKERDATRAVQPLEPRRGSTIGMVDHIREQTSKKIEPKEPPRGR